MGLLGWGSLCTESHYGAEEEAMSGSMGESCEPVIAAFGTSLILGIEDVGGNGRRGGRWKQASKEGSAVSQAPPPPVDMRHGHLCHP